MQNTPAATDSFLASTWLEGGMAILDSHGLMLEVNEGLANWLGKKSAELAGQPIAQALGENLSAAAESIRNFLKGPDAFGRFSLKATSSQWLVLEMARRDGVCFVNFSSTLPPLSELEEAAWNEHLGDDSARREMFMRLLQTEQQLDRLTRCWPGVVFSQRPDFSLQFASPNIAELTGISAEDWARQPRRFWELVHETDAAELRKNLKHAVQSGTLSTHTYRLRHALTGRVIYVLEHRQPVVSRNGLLLGYDAVWLDVTRQTIAEKRLSTAAWKETLAVLTLGMAHDFRNMMAGIHSLSESFVLQIDDKHPFREGLTLIQKSSMQASQLVQRMINLHLGQTGERNYQDLNEIARDLVELVSKLLPRRIIVQSELDPSQLPVYVDLVELRQVVINLLLNAADAMPNGGTLTLRTTRHESAPTLENRKGNVPRLPCVCLTIQDSGCGIKARHLPSIFDPFFTTKSKGSGLGLYNAALAVEKHQGAISVESQEGTGTRFNIWLPQADFSESSATDGTAAIPAPRRSLLLLGRSGEILDKTAELLRSHNYHIVMATEPESLGELLQSNDYQLAGVILLAEPNDLLIAPTLTEVRQNRRDLKVILKLAGCHQDDLNTTVLARVDLVLNPDLPESDMLSQLEILLK